MNVLYTFTFIFTSTKIFYRSVHKSKVIALVCFVTFHFIDEEGPVGTLSYSTSLYPSTLFRTFFLLLRSRVKNVNVKTKQPHFIPSNKNINYPFNTLPFFQTNERALPVTLKRLVLLDFFSFVPFWHLVLLF